MKNFCKALALSLAALVILPVTVFSAQLIEDGYYKIQARHSGKVMDIQHASTSNAASVIQRDWNGDDSQIWLIQYDPIDKAYLITSRHSQKNIDIQFESTWNGANAIQWDWNGQLNQKWEISGTGGGYNKLTAKHSGKCLEVFGGWYSNGVTVQQWSYYGWPHQQWKLTKLPIDPPGEGSLNSECATKYPILLLHGIMLRDSTLGYQYFGTIPNYLRSYGARVEGGGQQAWDSHSSNGEIIRQKIIEVLEAYGTDKVNIIAHSKGALETRAMVMDYPEMANTIASFTTVSTPHRGTSLGDIFFGVVPEGAYPYVEDIVNIIGLMQGDPDPNAFEAGMILTREDSAAWNALTENWEEGIPGVYCQSYGSAITGKINDPLLQTGEYVMRVFGNEAPNDGAVPISSAEYANFKGIEYGSKVYDAYGNELYHGVSHFAVVDRGVFIFPGNTPGFHAPSFFRKIVKDLKASGY
jgi:triacylglycerol lipase